MLKKNLLFNNNLKTVSNFILSWTFFFYVITGLLVGQLLLLEASCDDGSGGDRLLFLLAVGYVSCVCFVGQRLARKILDYASPEKKTKFDPREDPDLVLDTSKDLPSWFRSGYFDEVSCSWVMSLDDSQAIFHGIVGLPHNITFFSYLALAFGRSCFVTPPTFWTAWESPKKRFTRAEYAKMRYFQVKYGTIKVSEYLKMRCSWLLSLLRSSPLYRLLTAVFGLLTPFTGTVLFCLHYSPLYKLLTPLTGPIVPHLLHVAVCIYLLSLFFT
jgi:hypothetical protein